MTSLKTCAVVVLLLALSACKLGPNYQRPPLDVPGDYRGVAPEAEPSKTAAPSPLDTVPPGTVQPNSTQPQQPPPSAPAQTPDTAPQAAPPQPNQPQAATPAPAGPAAGQAFG